LTEFLFVACCSRGANATCCHGNPLTCCGRGEQCTCKKMATTITSSKTLTVFVGFAGILLIFYREIMYASL
jgi:hypothetical protein